MPNPLAAIPLTYAATDLQHADFGLYLEITQGLNEPPEVRGRDILVPGLNGMVVGTRRAHKLRIVLVGAIVGHGTTEPLRRSDFRATVRLLRTLFAPTRAPANLVATAEDGSTWTIAARPLPGIIIDELVPSEWASVSVVLESVAPDWTVT